LTVDDWTGQKIHTFKFPVDGATDQSLSGLPDLAFHVSLDLTHTKVTGVGLKALKNLKNLTSLDPLRRLRRFSMNSSSSCYR